MTPNQASLSAQIHAAYEWWTDVGVDFDFDDDATDWLATEEPAKSPKAATKSQSTTKTEDSAPPQKKIDLLGPNPPQDLKSFHEWWLNEPELDSVGVRGRIAPQGSASADLMILVMTPEEGDTTSLLTGEQGKLLDGFLGAAGLARDKIYLAAALPRHVPMVDGNLLKTSGYDEILLHHIKLAQPKRLIVMGRRILPLLGHETAQEPDNLQNINHENHILPLLAVEGLDSMIAMPRLKAKFWRKWLDWTDG